MPSPDATPEPDVAEPRHASQRADRWVGTRLGFHRRARTSAPARWLAGIGTFALALAAQAGPSVQLAGTMGAKAVLVVDGQAKTLAVGESHAGVKLLSLRDGQAQVDHAGAVLTLRLGAAPVAVGGGVAPSTGARQIVLSAGLGGHFTPQGSINGRAVQFMVDTGATAIALGQPDADRLGLDWKAGQRALTQTANGAVPVHTITLTSVRVGEVTVSNVAAVVVPQPMPYVLLGNSFLTRFQMRRDNDVMRLELRP